MAFLPDLGWMRHLGMTLGLLLNLVLVLPNVGGGGKMTCVTRGKSLSAWRTDFLSVIATP